MKKNSIKRLVCLLLAAMLLAVMAGCSDSPSGDNGGSDDGKTKIVLLLNGYLGDLAWYDCSAAGIQAIQDKYPDEVETKVIEMTTDKSKYDSIIADTLSEDWDIVIAGSWTMMEYIEAAAADYPEMEFWFFDEPIEGIDNVYSMSYNANEGAFLAAWPLPACLKPASSALSASSCRTSSASSWARITGGCFRSPSSAAACSSCGWMCSPARSWRRRSWPWASLPLSAAAPSSSGCSTARTNMAGYEVDYNGT